MPCLIYTCMILGVDCKLNRMHDSRFFFYVSGIGTIGGGEEVRFYEFIYLHKFSAFISVSKCRMDNSKSNVNIAIGMGHS